MAVGAGVVPMLGMLMLPKTIGKTVIAAFDYKRFKKENPRARLLFVAHRKEILEQSIQTFQEILNDFNFGELYVDGTRKVCEQ